MKEQHEQRRGARCASNAAPPTCDLALDDLSQVSGIGGRRTSQARQRAGLDRIGELSPDLPLALQAVVLAETGTPRWTRWAWVVFVLWNAVVVALAVLAGVLLSDPLPTAGWMVFGLMVSGALTPVLLNHFKGLLTTRLPRDFGRQAPQAAVEGLVPDAAHPLYQALAAQPWSIEREGAQVRNLALPRAALLRAQDRVSQAIAALEELQAELAAGHDLFSGLSELDATGRSELAGRAIEGRRDRAKLCRRRLVARSKELQDMLAALHEAEQGTRSPPADLSVLLNQAEENLTEAGRLLREGGQVQVIAGGPR